MSTPQSLLELYVEAKDLTRPHLVPRIYALDAVLTFSIATETISFPLRVEGRDGIAKTLVVDFGARFSRCKTYYVCVAPPDEGDDMVLLPWLVSMRETAVGSLRFGRGCYRWSFGRRGNQGIRVTAMHIHIDRMDEIQDTGGELLEATQSGLPYPWLPPTVLRSRYEALAQSDRALAFVDAFKLPVDPQQAIEEHGSG
jgi:hypothetical protein